MGFSLNANIEELFVVDENIKDSYSVNRLKTREIAHKIKKYISEEELSGGNKYAAELDANDATVELLTKIKLSKYSSLVALFNATLLEEISAISMLELEKQQVDFDKEITSTKEVSDEKQQKYTLISWFLALAAVLIFVGLLFS